MYESFLRSIALIHENIVLSCLPEGVVLLAEDAQEFHASEQM